MKLFWALVTRMNKISDELDNLYFEERPFLMHPTETVNVVNPDGTSYMETHRNPQVIGDKSNERKVLTMELDVIVDKIDKLVNPPQPKFTDKDIQTIFEPFDN